MSWVMTLFVYVILLCASTIHQVTGGNKTNVPTRADDNCVCYDMDGKAVNPTPLQSKDGSPRFKVRGLYGRKYGYNPCRSFAIGPAGSSDCYADVAICMWTTEGAKVYQNIGRQSTARCGYDKDYRNLRLEYRNDDARYAKNWEAHVIMKCDPSKSQGDATFEVIDDVHNPRKFLLTDNCLCAGQCPLDANPTVAPNTWEGKMTGGIIAGVVGIIVAAVCCWKREQICDGIRACYCNPNNDEHRPLNEQNNCIPSAENKKKNLTSKCDNVTV